MSLLSRVVDLVTFRTLPANRPAEVRQVGGSVIPYHSGRPQYPPHNTASLVDQGFNKNAAIYACIMARARALSAAPIRVYRTVDGQPDPVPDHPLRQLMNAPNPFQSEAEFVAMVSMIADATNFCVIEKQRQRPIFDGDPGRVIGLWPLRSDWIRPIPRDQAAPDWEYRIPGRNPETLKAADVVVYTVGDSPTMPYTGYGPMSVILREAAIDNMMTDHLRVFFERGALPQYFLIPRDGAELDQADADVLKEKLRYVSGLVNSVEPIVGVTIERIERMGFDFNELAYIDLRNMTEAHIAAVFGVPPGMIGLEVGMQHNTMMNSIQDEQRFYNNTITPLWARMDGAFTRGLLTEFSGDPTESLEFDTTEIGGLQEDKKEIASWVTPLVTGGALPVNMALKKLGFPPVVGGDIFLRSIATVEVPAVEEQQQRRNGRATVIEGEWRRILPQDERKALSGGLYRLAPEQRASAATAAKATIARLGDNFAPELQAFWREQGERIVATAKRSAALTAEGGLAGFEYREMAAVPPKWRIETRDIAEIAWDDEEEELRQVLRRLYVAAGESAATAVGTLTGQAGFSFDLANPWVRQVLNFLATRPDGPKGMTETTRQDVARIVTDSLTEGVTLDELGQRLTGLFEESYRNRAYTVGRTESQVAYNTASVEGYRATGVVGMAELADSTTHCEDYGASDGLSCCGRNGLIVPLDQVSVHIQAEHPNGSLAVLPVLATPLGEV